MLILWRVGLWRGTSSLPRRLVATVVSIQVTANSFVLMYYESVNTESHNIIL